VEDVARVVLAIEAHDVAEEVMHFLDRTGRARVVATAADHRQLLEAVRQLEPDVVVGQPGLVRGASLNGSALLALETRESVQALRAAIELGARGFFLWPAEREALARAAARLRAGVAEAKRGALVAVHGPRGGAGATFVATHLAAAFARRGRACVLVDLDPLFGDVAAALGAPLEPAPRTIADVLPGVEEAGPGQVERALWAHPAGFRALLAPGPEEAERLGASEVRALLPAVTATADVVLLHLPRALDGAARAALEAADRVLLVLSLDVLAFRAADRVLAVLEELGVADRVGFVVNRAARAEVAPADVEPALGRPPLAVVPRDPAVPAAQDHGRLLPMRGRTGRAFLRLARTLEEVIP
jgi:pilus assembly protein CpaE